MLSPGGTFVGPPNATPTYTVVPSEIPSPGVTVSNVMDMIPSLLQKAGITDFDGAMVTGFVDMARGSFNAICKSPIYGDDLRDPRNSDYKSAVESDEPCRCFLTGVIVSNHEAPCPNLSRAVYAGAAGIVGAAAADSPPGTFTHVHCLQLAPDSPLCGRPLADCHPAALGPAAGVAGVWHLNCLRSVVAADPDGGAAVRLHVFAVRDGDIRPHVPQPRLA